jgi:hypothetical protein
MYKESQNRNSMVRSRSLDTAKCQAGEAMNKGFVPYVAKSKNEHIFRCEGTKI